VGLRWGVDVDWEYPELQDRANVLSLFREFRQFLDAAASPLLLTAALPAGKKYYEALDLAAIHPFLDFLNIMTYDYHGSSFEPNGPINGNAPYCDPAGGENVRDTVLAYVAAGVPTHKLNMGLATYGRTWQLPGFPPAGLDTVAPVGAGKQGACTLQEGTIAYFELQQEPDVHGSNLPHLNYAVKVYEDDATNTWNVAAYDTKETHTHKNMRSRRNGTRRLRRLGYRHGRRLPTHQRHRRLRLRRI